MPNWKHYWPRDSDPSQPAPALSKTKGAAPAENERTERLRALEIVLMNENVVVGGGDRVTELDYTAEDKL